MDWTDPESIDFSWLDEERSYITTGIPGFDDLFEEGIPQGAAVLVAGGTGSGKTIFSLQNLAQQAADGKKCLYLSFEESERELIRHMDSFGMDPRSLIRSGNLVIKRVSPFMIRRELGSEMAKQAGDLTEEIGSTIIPAGFDPDVIVIDSLSSVMSTFKGHAEEYRTYVEQMFRYLESLDTTTFLVSETAQDPQMFSPSGVEEFLADGVIVLYNFRHGNVREGGIEVLKMRGESHEKKIVAMQITDEGISVYPDQEIFSTMD